MVSAEITGIGWVTTAGMGCGKDHDRFDTPCGPLPEIAPADVFDKPYPHFGRMDKYSRIGLTAIAFALKDAGLAEWKVKRNIGIIASTVYGCLGTDVDYYDTVMSKKGLGASPALFSYTLPNSFLGEAAIRFGLTGKSFIVNEQVPSGLACLNMSLDSIGCGESKTMLCGVCDLGCPPALGANSNLPPGALFFVIDKSPMKGSSTYGTVSLDRKYRILFRQTEIEDLTMLVRKCLTGYRSRQGKSKTLGIHVQTR